MGQIVRGRGGSSNTDEGVVAEEVHGCAGVDSTLMEALVVLEVAPEDLGDQVYAHDADSERTSNLVKGDVGS